MIARAVLLLVLAGPAAVLAQSQQVCPWMNAGTAAKTLGADVTVSAHADSNWSGSCRFVATNSEERSIEITVGKKDTHACGSNETPVVGIGNQAALCFGRGTDRQIVQILTGRVRNAWFVVRMALPPSAIPMTSSGNEPSDSSAIKFLAEQIAGSLY